MSNAGTLIQWAVDHWHTLLVIGMLCASMWFPFATIGGLIGLVVSEGPGAVSGFIAGLALQFWIDNRK